MKEQTSIVLELQRLASESEVSVTEILRKALLVATKLRLEDAKTWIQAELHGYRNSGADIPEYRCVKGSIEAYNPFQGRYMPCLFDDPDYAERISGCRVQNPINELEEATKEDECSFVRVNFSQRELNSFMSDGRYSPKPEKHIPINYISGIVAIVRTKVLEWALQLEAEGILGEGMTFSESEKKKAEKSVNIQIGTVGNLGSIGDVNAHNFQVGDFGAVHHQLKEAGLSQKERNEIENILDALKSAKPEEKPSIVQRGMDWLGRNAKTIGKLSAVVRGWLEAA